MLKTLERALIAFLDVVAPLPQKDPPKENLTKRVHADCLKEERDSFLATIKERKDFIQMLRNTSKQLDKMANNLDPGNPTKERLINTMTLPPTLPNWNKVLPTDGAFDNKTGYVCRKNIMKLETSKEPSEYLTSKEAFDKMEKELAEDQQKFIDNANKEILDNSAKAAAAAADWYLHGQKDEKEELLKHKQTKGCCVKATDGTIFTKDTETKTAYRVKEEATTLPENREIGKIKRREPNAEPKQYVESQDFKHYWDNVSKTLSSLKQEIEDLKKRPSYSPPLLFK